MSNEVEPTLLEKLKKLSTEELIKYESAAITADRVINVLGISVILLMCFFPEGIFILIGIIAVLLLANTGININRALIEIQRYLKDLEQVDK